MKLLRYFRALVQASKNANIKSTSPKQHEKLQVLQKSLSSTHHEEKVNEIKEKIDQVRSKYPEP